MSRINPPNTALIDAAGRATPEFYRFLVALQKDGSDLGVSIDDAYLMGAPFSVPSLAEVLDGGTLPGAVTGSAIVDFGAYPGSNEASVSFADTDILAGSIVTAYFVSSASTVDHTADDHKYAPLFIHLTAQATAGVGGTIYARASEKMQGQWQVNYSWS